MKTFTLLSAAVLSSVARAAVMENRQDSSATDISALPTVPPTTVASGSASASESFTSTVESTPGGFATLGLYTTCLEFTFTQAPIPVTPTPVCGSASASATGIDTSVIPILSSTDTVASVTPSVSASASAASGSSQPISTMLPIPVAVFSTCLMFLPTDTVTPTSTISGSATPTSSAVVSITSSVVSLPTTA
ncbi:hypothetical protein C8F01DRAFT_1181641 [Mycena amicta]|nr:hypothetical protein C8F01DRAFT_1181641 [Mycena amicta]